MPSQALLLKYGVAKTWIENVGRSAGVCSVAVTVDRQSSIVRIRPRIVTKRLSEYRRFTANIGVQINSRGVKWKLSYSRISLALGIGEVRE